MDTHTLPGKASTGQSLTYQRAGAEMVTADQMRWTLQPTPRVESVDLLTLDDAETFHYARDLQLELAAVRLLLSETLAALARAHLQGDRYQARLRTLLDHLRAARHECHVLRAQKRVRQDEAA